ncbi:TIM barrel protein [Microbacterium sp. LWH7-1.2]|uniref:TIM barrel protein n=1 Tax=Microbacterium sp. LWH7-1.2 TaxID=3135257 RepID=UPI0031390366
MEGLYPRVAAHLGISGPDSPLLRETAGSVDPVDQILAAADLGFAGVFDNSLLQRSVRDQRRMGRALAARSLWFGTCTLAAAHTVTWTDPGMDPRPAIQAAAAAMDRAGAKLLTVIVHDDGTDPAAQQRHAAAGLALAADEAVRHQITIGLEPVSPQRVPGVLVSRVATARAIVDYVSHPSLRLVADTCHIALEGDDVSEALRLNAGLWCAVQIADVPGRVEPGAGSLPFTEIFGTLRDLGWTDPVEAEFTPSQTGEAGERRAIALLEALRGDGFAAGGPNPRSAVPSSGILRL